MKEPVWILDEVVQAIHSMVIAQHGGNPDIRDAGLLESALTRPKQKYNYNSGTSVFELAAAYSYGITKNHPFMDGNKRTAFTVGTLFMELNGFILEANEPEVTIMFEALAASEIKETHLSLWFKENST